MPHFFIDKPRSIARPSALLLSGWLLAAASLALPAPVQATECSLVVNGSLQDVPCSRDPASGLQISLEALSIVARTAGNISLSARADRGHIVLASGQKNPTVASLAGFKTPGLTVVIDGKPLSFRGTLVSGSVYLDTLSLQTILERLEFNVLIEIQSGLISVFHMPGSRRASDEDDSGVNSAESAGGGSTRPPGAGMMESVQAGSSQSLQALNPQVAADLQKIYQQAGIPFPGGTAETTSAATGASSSSARASSSSSTSVSSASASEVCASMDRLRTQWESTEPSADEKATFKKLAQTFQAAKDNKQSLQDGDVDELGKKVDGFHLKAKKRLAGTRSWSPPEPARRVKLYGEDFLMSVDELLTLSEAMVKAIKEKDKNYHKQAQADIDRLKELEKSIQEAGMRFDAEVTKVRSSHGCSGARSGTGPS